MNFKLILYSVIKMIKDSKNSSIQIRQLTHNKVLKMFSIYLILKKRQEKGNINSGFANIQTRP